MPRVALLSDTHGRLLPLVREAVRGCEEIWHAGDVGAPEVLEGLRELAPLRAVHGNIDGAALRRELPEDLRFECGGFRVLMTHIGGYPGRYAPRARRLLREEPPDLFVCGHSHLLRVMGDPGLGLLHLNPGACGDEGFHEFRTLIRMTLEGRCFRDVEVVELGLRGAREATLLVKPLDLGRR